MSASPTARRPLLNLPFHYAIDDAMFFSFAWLNSENDAQRMMDPDHVEEIWWAAFLQQYQQGGYLNICMHPFVSGRALRIAMLDRLIDAHEGACPACGSRPASRWRATSSACIPQADRSRAMPWKDRYTISDEKSLLDSDVRWPDGQALLLPHRRRPRPACGPDGITPQDLTTPDAYFGMHGGLAALGERAEALRPQGDLRGARP